jgi:hypothetical protein
VIGPASTAFGALHGARPSQGRGCGRVLRGANGRVIRWLRTRLGAPLASPQPRPFARICFILAQFGGGSSTFSPGPALTTRNALVTHLVSREPGRACPLRSLAPANLADVARACGDGRGHCRCLFGEPPGDQPAFTRAARGQPGAWRGGRPGANLPSGSAGTRGARSLFARAARATRRGPLAASLRCAFYGGASSSARAAARPSLEFGSLGRQDLDRRG